VLAVAGPVLSQLPPDDRPRLFVFGESLGELR